jgi:hypothetical protein
MKVFTMILGGAILSTGTIANEDAAAVCQIGGSAQSLPSMVKESSGLARSRRDPGVFWTHNDAGNAPVLFAVSPDGKLRGEVKVAGARLEDWEDIAAAPCGTSNCLLVGDIGDNSGKRKSITIYRIPEPVANASTSSSATAIEARYPGGPRDAEAMFVASGDIYIVTKGRKGPIELYKLPDGASGTATLEKVRDLFPAPKSSSDRVTAASASPDGKWVGIRTYRTLYLFPGQALISRSSAIEPLTMDLTPLNETKGEGLAVANDGSVWLSSEAGNSAPPRIASIKCSLPASMFA